MISENTTAITDNWIIQPLAANCPWAFNPFDLPNVNVNPQFLPSCTGVFVELSLNFNQGVIVQKFIINLF